MSKVLALDSTGFPRKWIDYDDAITYVAKGMVLWETGDKVKTYHGGYQRDGHQSILQTASIIALKGRPFGSKSNLSVPLNNKTLFGRDDHTCAYCGRDFAFQNLSRDHIMPLSKGGKDVWTNVVTACKDCNCDKGNMTLDESGMNLLYLPYSPNYYEHMILTNHYVSNEQLDYLMVGLNKSSRILKTFLKNRSKYAN